MVQVFDKDESLNMSNNSQNMDKEDKHNAFKERMNKLSNSKEYVPQYQEDQAAVAYNVLAPLHQGNFQVPARNNDS